jgi:hypothetical protein
MSVSVIHNYIGMDTNLYSCILYYREIKKAAFAALYDGKLFLSKE